jgi:hypothetical protein
MKELHWLDNAWQCPKNPLNDLNAVYDLIVGGRSNAHLDDIGGQ